MGLHQKRASRANQNFRNFQRGIIYEVAAACFGAETGATLSGNGMFVLTSVNQFAASPDHIFDGKACSMLTNIYTGEKIQFAGRCLLEIKTRAEGETEPLSSVTASHGCQTELQMKCVGDEVQFTTCILQSFVPKSKKSKYFLMYQSNQSFNIPPPPPPPAYPGHLMPFPAWEGGSLIILVFPGTGHLITSHRGGEFDCYILLGV